jgi:hypothetical protein
MPVNSMGLPSGFVPKAPLFVPVTRNVEATRDPSRFSKESTTSESKFPMAALKSSTHFLNASRPSIHHPARPPAGSRCSAGRDRPRRRPGCSRRTGPPPAAGRGSGQAQARYGMTPADGHEHAARAAVHVAAPHLAQVTADQPGARAQADQARRAHPPLCGGLGIRQREEAADLHRAVRPLGPLPGQRHVMRIQLRHDTPADEPLIGAQRAARRPGQARRAAGEPLDHRRVEYHLRCQVQAQRRRVIRELARRPQQVLRPLPPLRPGPGDRLPGERRRPRRH